MLITLSAEGFDKANTDLTAFVAKTVSSLSTNITEEIRVRTPIKSGRARRGWQNRTGTSGAIINNNVPYIQRLEDGYSSQARQGFVKQGIAAGVDKTNKEIK
jgi:hypothetical protein